MKKRTHEADLFIKDLKASNDLSDLTFQNMKNERTMPGFTARYEAELEKRGRNNVEQEAEAQAA